MARPIGHEAPEVHKLPPEVHRWQPVPGREVYDTLSLGKQHRTRQRDERVGAPPRHRGERAVEVLRSLRPDELKLDSQPPGSSLRLLHHLLPRAFSQAPGMPEDRHAGDPGNGLLEQREAFWNQLRAKEGQSCDIPARPGEARDKPVPDGILHRRRDDGNRAEHDDEVDPEAYHLGREGREPLDPPLRRPVLDDNVPALDVAQFPQRLPELVEPCPGLGMLKGGGREHTDLENLRRLLRLGGERRGEEATS